MAMNQHHDDHQDAMNVDQGQAQKVQTLHDLSTGSLASSVSELSGSSRGVPSGKDFHFFYNFDEFKAPIQEISKKSQSMLEAIGSSTARVWGDKEMTFPARSDIDDAYDWLVNVNDELLERFHVSADEFQRVRKKEEETGQAVTDTDDGFQVVYGKKKKWASHGSASHGSVGGEASVAMGVKVATKDKKTTGPKQKVPFHIPSIRKPQDELNILVNNSNQPFEHVWLQRSEDGLRFIHPLEKLSVLDFVDKDIGNVDPIKPPSLESTPFKFVEEVKDLKEMAAKLRGVNEFAVDLEHNQYRSFQGLTCLMQISTRTEDFVVDTLKLRIHIGPYLREVFKDPTKRKVMHGADRDIVWLQRDFGIYVCNLFDTGQASKVLKLERNSLEFLLHHFCGVTANKEYQNADWRLRPLPEEMLRYAREDTHYLLHIYDLMRIKLFSMPKESENFDTPLVEVYKRSYDVCMQLYEKELLTDNSYLYIYGLQAAALDAQQLAVVAGLCEWRDVVARAEDESTGYVLPNKVVLEIAKHKPDSTSKLRRLVKSKHPYIERNLASVVSVIRHSLQNAADFEAVAEHLKLGHTEMAAEENIVVADGFEVFLPDTPTEVEAANARRESIDCSNTINGHISVLLPASSELKAESSELGCSALKLGRGAHGGSYEEHSDKSEEVNINSDSCISDRPSGGLTTSGQSRDANDDTLVLHSAKVTGATVQMLKKPSRAFGALLGSSAPKRKFNTDKREEMKKLEQIRSSVNFPFHSFRGMSEQSKPAVEICDPQGSVAMPAASPQRDEIILLEDNSEAEESIGGNSEGTNEQKNNFGMSGLELDNRDEPMSLSELSSSFEKCFESINQNGKARQVGKSQESGFLQLKPFDYEAARKEVRFGEDGSERSASGSNKGLKVDSGKKKKGSVIGGVQRDDGTTELLPQGRRRQAFPTTGNRSATFR
ncbi:protein RRP6-like 2 [Alnus glutinosa]|uniref:protein RRP6-like 2 n=1 Tax=Alnus glutinosa TaxID=3517 RepID=UPI002D7716DB|nr:protein RRP6-like 2 [Alnus glutinosa]